MNLRTDLDAKSRAMQLRREMLEKHLSHCHEKGDQWEPGIVSELMLPTHQAPQPVLAPLLRLLENVPVLQFFVRNGPPCLLDEPEFLPWMDLARAAIKSHCTPLVTALLPLIERDNHAEQNACFNRKTRLGFFLAFEGPFQAPSESFDPLHFRSTVRTLMLAGLDLNDTATQCLHRLAAGGGLHTVAKLAILLDLGIDPNAKTPQGYGAVSHLRSDEHTAHWLAVVHSFEARQQAKAMLREMEKETLRQPIMR